MASSVPTNAEMDYVCGRVAKARTAFRRLRNYNRRVSWAFACSATLFSAAATVAVGLKSDEKTALDVVALAASSLATVVSATASVFSHRKLWHLNNIAFAAFDKLQRDIEFRQAAGQPITSAEAKEFYARYDKIPSDIDEKWVDTYAVKWMLCWSQLVEVEGLGYHHVLNLFLRQMR